MLVDMRDAFFEELVIHAKQNPNIIILTADHGAFALEEFSKNYPHQFINIGIAEQNMVGVAAGLALSGKIVFIYGIAPFVSLRVLEQLTVDVVAMKLPVNVVSVGAGFTYSTDGPSHQGLQDINAISSIPGIKILNSSDPINSKFFVRMALEAKTPHYIRIEKEKLAPFDRMNLIQEVVKNGFSILHKGESKLLVVTTGYQTHRVLNVVEKIRQLGKSNFNLIDVHQIKPITPELQNYLTDFSTIVVIEESFPTLVSLLKNALKRNSLDIISISVSENENNIMFGSDREEMLEMNGLSLQAIEEAIFKI